MNNLNSWSNLATVAVHIIVLGRIHGGGEGGEEWGPNREDHRLREDRGKS